MFIFAELYVILVLINKKLIELKIPSKFISIAREFLYRLQIRLIFCFRQSTEDELKIKKHRLEILSLLRLSLDFVHAVSYLPTGYLWGGKLSTFQIGAVGTASAAIGIYQIFAKRRLNK